MLAGRLFLSMKTSCQTMRLSLTRSHVKWRDYVVTIRSGEGVLVIVNVNFEPDLVMRDLRERLRRISSHLPR